MIAGLQPTVLHHCQAVLASRTATEHQEQIQNLILISRNYLKYLNEKQESLARMQLSSTNYIFWTPCRRIF